MAKPSQRPAATSSPSKPQAATPAHGTCDISDWAAAQYTEHVGLASVEGGTGFKTLIKAFPVRSRDPIMVYPSSGRERVLGGFLTLKFRYPIGSDGYSCLAMAAKVDGVSTHFGYAYWRRGQEAEGPEYICISPTFDSRDGEYRRGFIRGPVFLEAYERLASELDPYEKAVLAMVGGGLELRSVAYPEAAAEAIIIQANDLRLPVLVFSVAIMLDLWEVQNNLMMVHTCKAYIALMNKIAKMWPNLLLDNLTKTVPSVRVFRQGSTVLHDVKCGQKLVPMYTREAMQPFDYNLVAWRELAVTRIVGDLVLNFVSPSFALYNQWAYIEGADAALFENKAMGERYARGNAVDVAMRPLREARRLLNDAEQNYHTEELSARFYESLKYAQSYLHMSPFTLAHTMEDVGWSMQSLSSYVRFAPTQWPAAIEAFADPDTAARHLFELAYAAHCLHTKVGIAHTDLHTNNMTFYRWGVADAVKVDPSGAFTYTPLYEDPFVAYVAGPRGEADTYIFPGAGDSACIIDYSRCILGPAFRQRLEEGRSPQYATNFYRDQVNRVMRAFHRYAPEYVAAHQDAIKAAVLANFEAAFPVLCAVDFIAIGANIGEMLLDAAQPLVDEIRPFMVSHAANALALRLEDAGRELLITGLHDLAESAGARREMKTPKPPGAAVLERVFGEWLFPRWAAREPGLLRTAQLVDAYNYNNDISRYSGSDYAKYPPWGRLDEIERHLGEHKLTDLFERGVEPFLAALRPGARVEVIAEQIRAQQEKLDGKPVSAASSWIDE